MDRRKRFHIDVNLFLVAITLSIPLVGCSGDLGTAKEQLQPFWPEEYSFAEPPTALWGAVEAVAASQVKQQGRFLVNDPNSRVISWVEKLETGPELSRRQKRKMPEPAPMERLRKTEVGEIGGGGTVITTVMINRVSNGSMMRLRRSYYGQLTRPLMVHSRGEYASLFHDLVIEKLSKKGI